MKRAFSLKWGGIAAAILCFVLFGLYVFGVKAAASETESSTKATEKTETEAAKTGWIKKGKKTYYLDEDGKKVTGLQKIDGRYYYFSKKGVRKTGWRTVKGTKYYFDPNENGARARGFTKIGKKWYYFKKNGKTKTGWLKKNGEHYYLGEKGRVTTGWKTIGGKKYYFKKPTGERVTGNYIIKGTEYSFTKKGVLRTKGYTKDGSYIDSTGHKLRKNTIKGLLKTALKPVGSTMYVWGGGWNTTDNGSGIISRTIGVSPRWKAFFKKQNSSYDYTKTRYQMYDGLDCSGYVGWTIYNTFNTTSGNAGYVMLAQVMARTYASYGWGTYTSAGSVKNFKAGDIMSLASGHVYIVVGQCSDGSVVLLHSSPKGVMISGTTKRNGSKNSQAIKLATKYMKKYYPAWYAKFPDSSRGASYLTSYSQMRWHIKGKKAMLTDPDGYRKKSASKILKDLFKK